MNVSPQSLANKLPEVPAPSDFVAMGPALVGKQPSVMDLVNKCADSMQAQKRAAFEAGFIAEKMRLMGETGPNAEKAIRAMHLKRTNHDYDSLEAHMAWWAWQAASSLTQKN